MVVWLEVSAPSVGFKEHQPSDVSHLLTLIARTCHYTPLPVPQLNQEGQDRKVVFSINYVITFGCPERSYKEAIKEAKCYAARWYLAPIPHICHESHENSRVNIFWPV